MLQTTFYILGIITMTIFLGVCLAGVGMFFKLKRDAQHFRETFISRIMGLLQERNIEIASALGLTVGHFLLDKWKRKSAKKVD